MRITEVFALFVNFFVHNFFMFLIKFKMQVVNNFVDNVNNYSLISLSPTKYTSPAPIVINRSLSVQLFST